VDDFSVRIASLLAARNADPFGLLGRIRWIRRKAACGLFARFGLALWKRKLSCKGQANPIPMRQLRDTGVFEADTTFPQRSRSHRRRAIACVFATSTATFGNRTTTYAFPYLLTEFDL